MLSRLAMFDNSRVYHVVYIPLLVSIIINDSPLLTILNDDSP